jgi:hypothetical protein
MYISVETDVSKYPLTFSGQEVKKSLSADPCGKHNTGSLIIKIPVGET